jgi:hypothetical protein
MIENENQRLPGGDPLATLDGARWIVETDQRFSQPSKERRNPPAHAKIIRRIAGGLPSPLETPAGTRIPGAAGDHHQAQTAIPTSRHTASSHVTSGRGGGSVQESTITRVHFRGAVHRLLQPMMSRLSTHPVAGMVGSPQARISHWQPATLSHVSRVASATQAGGQSE